jgi:hypothetical protein
VVAVLALAAAVVVVVVVSSSTPVVVAPQPATAIAVIVAAFAPPLAIVIVVVVVSGSAPVIVIAPQVVAAIVAVVTALALKVAVVFSADLRQSSANAAIRQQATGHAGGHQFDSISSRRPVEQSRPPVKSSSVHGRSSTTYETRRQLHAAANACTDVRLPEQVARRSQDCQV